MSSSLPHLEQKRAELYEKLIDIGDFRRGTITATYRRCGKANCVCANPGHPGHGPRHLLTRSLNGKTRAVQLNAGAELEKANREVAKYKQFQATVAEIVAISEAICDARPISRAATPSPETVTDPEKGGSAPSSARRSRRR